MVKKNKNGKITIHDQVHLNQHTPFLSGTGEGVYIDVNKVFSN